MAKPSAAGKAAAARTVRTWRAGLRLTQQELAQQAGINVDTLSDLESGTRWPRTKTLRAVERAAGRPAGELDRIAEEEGTSGEPEIPSELMELIERMPPETQQRLIDRIRQHLAGGTAPPQGTVPSGRHRRASA